jgi:cytochrome c55X
MHWLASATTSLVLVAAVGAAEPAGERRDELRNLLVQDCGSCHGLTFRGGLGPALTPEALADKSVEYVHLTIWHGRPGTAMPPWRGLLTEDESRWLARLLISGEARQ